jgi:hypothetical protein
VINKRLLGEPLLHFAVLGLALFVLYGFLNNDSDYVADEIVIDQQRQSMLTAEFQKVWQRPPTDEEYQSLIDARIREEVLYREGLALGYDRNDPVIRRRVAQKMSFVADGMAPENPDDSELEAWLQANIDDYQIPAEYTLQQVYIDPQRHRDDLDAVLGSMHARLSGGDASETEGDFTSLPGEITSESSLNIVRVFGTEFVSALADLAIGNWQGPIKSGYGLHFVMISEYIPARDPQLEEVRSALQRDLSNDQSKKINQAFYAALRERYTIRIEPREIDD